MSKALVRGIRMTMAVVLLTGVATLAQDNVKRYNGKISQQITVDSKSVIINKSNRKRITYHEFEKLDKANPGMFRLEPVFDIHGEPSSFFLTRSSSGQSGNVIAFNDDMMPEVGEELPPFVMKGLDGVTYDSQKLKGKFVLLGFWVRYEKPLYSLATTKVIKDFISDQQRRGIDIVSLGTTLDSEEECLAKIPKRNCGFVPVPDSYGFNHRYHIGETPFFILLDRQGRVKAMAPHTEFSKIGDLKLR